jgi:cytochrome d ubiquinol oxidase subunit II
VLGFFAQQSTARFAKFFRSKILGFGDRRAKYPAMAALWFGIVTAMIAMYAILDGFDLGAGVIHLFLARTESDRRSVLAAAGQFWDGNEVWLLLAGGAVYCAFPAVYASRGFYLPAIVLVWLLMLRGMGTELRQRVTSQSARRLLDRAFGISSILLTLSLGAAVGYVGSGHLSWFSLLCAVCGLAILTLQSAAWMAMKSTGELQQRCRRLASRVWWAVLLCYAGVTAVSLATQPRVLQNLLTHSWISALVVVTLAGLIGAHLCLTVGFDLGAFASACCVVAGLLASAAAGQFPYLAGNGLTVYDAGSAHHGMSISAVWWIPAFVLAVAYNARMHRLFGHKMADNHSHPVTAGN